MHVVDKNVIIIMTSRVKIVRINLLILYPVNEIKYQ